MPRVSKAVLFRSKYNFSLIDMKLNLLTQSSSSFRNYITLLHDNFKFNNLNNLLNVFKSVHAPECSITRKQTVLVQVTFFYSLSGFAKESSVVVQKQADVINFHRLNAVGVFCAKPSSAYYYGPLWTGFPHCLDL